jgi:hypothetical protein
VKQLTTKISWFAIIGGSSLAVAGALISNQSIESYLVSDPYSLKWGPTLFRSLLIIHGLAIALAPLWMKENGSTGLLIAQDSAHRSKTSWSSWVTLITLGLIAFALRLWHLNTDLWFDELLSLLNFVRQPLGEIVTRLPDQNNHILFSVLSHESVRLFGESAWAVRFPSVVFGVMSIGALFLLGRRLLGVREALLACSLMTFSYHHIWFSQNARGYMALLFFSLLATWLWFEALDRNSWKWWIGYAIAITAGMLSHMTMVFVVAAHFVIYALMFVRWVTKRTAGIGFNWMPLVGFVLSSTLTLQFYALALPEFIGVGLHETSLESEWTNPWWVITETLRSLRIGFSGGVVVTAGALLLGIGGLTLARRDWQAGVLMVLPPFLAGGSMIMLGHNLWPRFFFFCMGFILLIAIQGAMTLPVLISKLLTSWPALQRLAVPAGGVLALLMILASAATVPRNYTHPKQDYSGARDYVESHRGPDDAVVAVGLAGVAYERYYAPKWSAAQTETELNVVRRGHNQTWLVYTLPVEVKAYRKAVWEIIQSDFEIVKIFPGTLGGGEVVVCKERLKPTPQTNGDLLGGSGSRCMKGAG